jgi:two-component system, NtrC family, response regulator
MQGYLDGVIASSAAMLKVCRVIERLAPTDLTVLFVGESGTGKERLALALHRLSSRRAGPLVAINCAAIPDGLLESELFGYERGAFSGAVRQTIGRIESADGGTLFLDEVGDMPLSLQAKMLRFLQERVIERLGGRRVIPVDVRIVAATHRILETEVGNGNFRLDLYHRLNEVFVEVPPLREREADCVLLANHLLQQACRRHDRAQMSFAPDAIRAIEQYSWPGNVRELENCITRAVVMAEGSVVTSVDLGLAKPQGDSNESFDLRTARRLAEARAVSRALALTAGNLTKAAARLGVTRPALYHLMRRLSILPSAE